MPIQSPSLYAHTRALLRDRPRTLTLRQVADATGVTVDWLAMILRDNNLERDPSANRVQAVYEFLAGKPLINDNL